MSTPFLAEIKMFAGNFNPRGYALCNGQIMSISQNTALFSLLGTQYGGNGTSTFALPNLQSRAPMHRGTGPGLTDRVIGEEAGEESVTLLTSEMPSHTHIPMASSAAGNAVSPAAATWASSSGDRSPPPFYQSASTPGVNMNPVAVGINGSSQPHNNMQPFLVINFIIALQGIFPARN
jgi:microcystin-dependent protein